jgi:hypothetical protein
LSLTPKHLFFPTTFKLNLLEFAFETFSKLKALLQLSCTTLVLSLEVKQSLECRAWIEFRVFEVVVATVDVEVDEELVPFEELEPPLEPVPDPELLVEVAVLVDPEFPLSLLLEIVTEFKLALNF